MRDYLLVARTGTDDRSLSASDALLRLARARRLVVTDLAERVWIATDPALSLRRIGAWTLIGDLLNRDRPRLPQTAPDDPWAFERKFVARFWGRYVGVRVDRRGVDALLRDPSGAVECVAWEQDGLLLACSHAHDWLLDPLRPDWSINPDRLARALGDPLAGAGALLLDGPVALLPGTVQPVPLETAAIAIWSPSDFARRSLGDAPSPDDAEIGLRKAIDEAVAGFAGLPGALAAEVSGGLDSSLVASSLVRQAVAPLSLWLNAYGAAPEADERSYAFALGEALGFTPTCVPHARQDLTSDFLDALPAGFRPGVAVLDTAHDMVWRQRLEAADVGALMTGKGGDSILIQAPSANVFVDLWRRQGWKALRSPDMLELAAANEISLWTMVQAARRHRLEGPRALAWRHPILRAPPPGPVSHPWLEDCEDLGPAKIFQIAGVADSVSHNAPSGLAETIDLRHPLGAQPVVEACLALPAWRLALGGRDRGLARAAFRDRLPARILERRSKGDMTRLYARMIVDRLDVIRPWLMEGRLADLGLIDPVAAGAELTPDVLVWRGPYAPLMAAIVFEGWVRAWERRLGRTTRAPTRPDAAPAMPGSA